MRETSISSASSAKMRWLLSRIIVTRAMPTGLRPAAAGKDDVFHLRAAQRFRALLTEHPADRIHHVALAAAVWPDNGGHPRRKKKKYTLSAKDLKPLDL